MTHLPPTNARGQILQGETPGGKRLRDEIGVTRRQEAVEACQDPFFPLILPPQRSLERQVVPDSGGQDRTERFHDATSVAQRSTSDGRSSATSRRSSTARRSEERRVGKEVRLRWAA